MQQTTAIINDPHKVVVNIDPLMPFPIHDFALMHLDFAYNFIEGRRIGYSNCGGFLNGEFLYRRWQIGRYKK
jgi:hypothetical protein